MGIAYRKIGDIKTHPCQDFGNNPSPSKPNLWNHAFFFIFQSNCQFVFGQPLDEV